MAISILIAIATFIIALNGIVFQTKKNPDGPVHWRNSNTYGKVLFGLIVLLAVLSLIDNCNSEKKHRKEVERLLEAQDSLKMINQRLIKVVSVSSGYNALIKGVVTFNRARSDYEIRTAINNAFLKCIEIELTANNSLGNYKGRVDHGLHPETRRYLPLLRQTENADMLRYRNISPQNSYYFEARCANLKILNEEKIQYIRMGETGEQINANLSRSSWYSSCLRLYDIYEIFLDEIEIEELGPVKIRNISFRDDIRF